MPKSINFIFYDELIEFGEKHYGETIGDVINSDPEWVLWARDNIDDFFLSEDLENELTASMEINGVY